MRKYLLHSYMVLILSVAFLNLGCPKERITPEENPLQLTIEDVSCTEAFLKLSLAESEQNRVVSLKRNDSLIATITMSSSDSLFVDEGLLPKQTYTYTLLQINFTVSAQATTMDTTSHDWSWEITTLGNGSSSILYDVAIVNDTLAYAVGEIHTNETDKFDSLGNWVNPYNVAKWDGKKWELQRLMHNCRLYYPNCGDGNGGGTMLYVYGRSVFAFSPSDVWIAAGGVHHFNGTNWTEEAGIIGAGAANKIWGDKTAGLYFVGNNGFIAHRSANGAWQKIESGTDLNFHGIYGAMDSKTGEFQILAVCSRNNPLDRDIFQIVENNAIQVSSYSIQWELYGVWFASNRHYYVVGDGIYEKTFLTDSIWRNKPLDITRYGTDGINGNGINDVFVVGAYGEILHFNGISWRSYIDKGNKINGAYGGVDVYKNLVMTVGFVDNKACIAIGKR